MRLSLLSAAILGLGLVWVAGCERNPSGDKAASIKYEVFPTEIIVLKPGDSKDVTVKRSGKDLKDAKLTVTSSDPKVKVKGGEFKGAAGEATVTVQAEADAPAKEHTITVKAGDVTKTINIRVEAAGAANTPPTIDPAPADDKKKNNKD